ncbi:hypothetical protein GCM10011380_31890 [Sphingomonas metalli]|uniref:Uncharacterized protein n=1 Tax=Sphingomonas metalli TaxID=1779358 RepID=A0A916TCT0_9SPHN|nr:hypothetical protein [Sphingomonas metalli]GGB40065.1 hypothetical protein GCM10011380_31890 [Sphingomonas metalli]
MNRADEDGRQALSARTADAEHDHVGRRLRTLEQCALHKRTLRLTCPRCRHVRILDAVPLWWLFQRRGWDDALPAVIGRLRCSSCGGRGGAAVRPRLTVGRDPPTGAQFPYPDAASWKKLVSRYRS